MRERKAYQWRIQKGAQPVRPPPPVQGPKTNKINYISDEIWSRMRYLRPHISIFSGEACLRTPLEHISVSCGVYKFLQKSAPPPPSVCQFLYPPLPTMSCTYINDCVEAEPPMSCNVRPRIYTTITEIDECVETAPGEPPMICNFLSCNIYTMITNIDKCVGQNRQCHVKSVPIIYTMIYLQCHVMNTSILYHDYRY